jgi:DNA polymerase-1
MNFGVIYGLSAFGISQQTDLPRDEGAKFIESYFSRYPGIRDYLEATKAQARKQGYLETMRGRRRYIPEVNASNYQVRQAAERMAVNTVIQGTEADLIKKAMVEIGAALRGQASRARLLLQVHDELVFETPRDDIDALCALATKLMRGAPGDLLSVPLEVEVGVGDNWREAH